MTVDCQACGWVLQVPYGTEEGREFACGHCGLLLRNVEPTRTFQWQGLDPFVRRRGVTRLVFWLGIVAGFVWLPALAIALALRHGLDPRFVAAIGAPWLAIEFWLARSRAGRPRIRWYVLLWLALGAYVTYVAILVGVVPAWRSLLGVGENPDALRLIFSAGVMAMMVGAAGASGYRWVLSRTPTARATPPSPNDRS